MKRYKEILEQHPEREKARFKPMIPKIVLNTPVVSPRDKFDVNVKIARKKAFDIHKDVHKENTDIDIPKDAPSVESIAKKHGVSVAYVKQQLESGMKIEAEHGKNKGSEREIALDHLNEKPDYYKKLKKYVEEVEQIDEISAQAHKSYQSAARKDITGLTKHIGGEYGDIAKNIINRRVKGLTTSTGLQARDRMAKLKKEESEIVEGENKQVKGGDPCWKGYQMVGMKNKGGKKVPNCVPEEVEKIYELSNELLHRYKEKAATDSAKADKEGDYKRGDKRFSGVIKATNKQFDKRKTMSMEETEKAPFEGGTTKPKQKVVVGKAGKSMATARHLARLAMKKQMENLPKKTVKEESNKMKLVKDIMQKKKKTSEDAFQKDPVLSGTIIRNT